MDKITVILNIKYCLLYIPQMSKQVGMRSHMKIWFCEKVIKSWQNWKQQQVSDDPSEASIQITWSVWTNHITADRLSLFLFLDWVLSLKASWLAAFWNEKKQLEKNHNNFFTFFKKCFLPSQFLTSWMTSLGQK